MMSVFLVPVWRSHLIGSALELGWGVLGGLHHPPTAYPPVCPSHLILVYHDQSPLCHDSCRGYFPYLPLYVMMSVFLVPVWRSHLIGSALELGWGVLGGLHHPPAAYSPVCPSPLILVYHDQSPLCHDNCRGYFPCL